MTEPDNDYNDDDTDTAVGDDDDDNVNDKTLPVSDDLNI